MESFCCRRKCHFCVLRTVIAVLATGCLYLSIGGEAAAADIEALASPSDPAPPSTGTKLYTYFAWIVLPFTALVVSVYLSAQALRDRLHRKVSSLESALQKSQEQRNQLHATLARQDTVLRKLSTVTLVDQVSAASGNEDDHRRQGGDQPVSLPS